MVNVRRSSYIHNTSQPPGGERHGLYSTATTVSKLAQEVTPISYIKKSDIVFPLDRGIHVEANTDYNGELRIDLRLWEKQTGDDGEFKRTRKGISLNALPMGDTTSRPGADMYSA